MAKSAKEDEKTVKDGVKNADSTKSDNESKAKEAPPKPVDPVTAFLNGTCFVLFRNKGFLRSDGIQS